MPIDNALIVGAGFSGMAAALELRKRGVAVELVEIDPNWGSYRAGISISGATLRALDQLGILDKFLEVGFVCDGVDILAPDDSDAGQLRTPRAAGAGIPGGGGVMRPALARLLADAVIRAGAEVRIGCTYKAMRQHDEGVEVELTDGRRRDYDLVVAADGVHSTVRGHLFARAPRPGYMGQGAWCALLPRPAELTRTTLWVGPDFKAGLDPVSRDGMYLFFNERRESGEGIAEAQLLPTLKGLLKRCPSPRLRELAGALDAASSITYRPIEKLPVPAQWHVGRVVLIGDAAHATAPHLGSGVCMGMEDALVLAEELERADTVEKALQGFQARRWGRCRLVEENSARLCEIELSDGDRREHARIMQESFMALAEPF